MTYRAANVHVLTDVTFNSIIFFFPVALRPNAGQSSSFLRFLDHTQRRLTVGRTPLDSHNRETSMPPVGFEPTIAAGERP